MKLRTRQSDLTRRLTEQLHVAEETIEAREAELAAQLAENRRLRSMLQMEIERRHNVETHLNTANREVDRLQHDEKTSHINEELQIMNEELEAAHHRIQERLALLKRRLIGFATSGGILGLVDAASLLWLSGLS